MRTPRLLAFAAIALLAAAPASAVELRYHAKEPTSDEAAAVWPKDEAGRPKPGHATGVCSASEDGVLHDCQVIFEEPQGQGFGAALLAVAGAYRAMPSHPHCMRDGSFMVIDQSFPEVDVKPQWLAAPDPRTRLDHYPKDARRRHLEGIAVLGCTPQPGGELKDCRTLHEYPQGQGFGEAALGMAADFRIAPSQQGGRPVEEIVSIPVWFFLTLQRHCRY